MAEGARIDRESFAIIAAASPDRPNSRRYGRSSSRHSRTCAWLLRPLRRMVTTWWCDGMLEVLTAAVALESKPPGRRLSFRGMTWFGVKAGRIVEVWDAWNQGVWWNLCERR